MRMWLLVTATAVLHIAGLYESEYRSCVQSRSAAQDKRLWPDNTHNHWQQHARCSVLLHTTQQVSLERHLQDVYKLHAYEHRTLFHRIP